WVGGTDLRAPDGERYRCARVVMKRGVGRLPAVPMTARYATTCRVCSGPVQPGDEISKADQGWAPGPCPATPPDTSQTAAAQKAAPTRARREMPAVDGALEVWTDGACAGTPRPGGGGRGPRAGRRGAGG